MELKKRIISLLSVASMIAFSTQPVGAAMIYEDVTEPQATARSHFGSDGYCTDKAYTGNGVTIAMLDTGVTDFNTSQHVSFVGDDEVLSGHGNDMAGILYEKVPDAEILDVRVLDNNAQGKYSDVNRGITWSVDNGADIIVMSFAGKEASRLLEDALEYAEENEVLVIASAGNYSSDEAVYPAAYPTVVSVGAVDEFGEICTYSNYGEAVDFFTYASEGTSSAAQYAAAIAAQYMEESPEKSFDEIRNLFTSGKEKSFESVSEAEELVVYAQACKSHTFNGSYTTTKAATCTATGTKVGKCTKCGKVVSTVTIPKLGHKESSSWTTTKAATCTSTGTRIKKCTRCSAVARTETIAKTAHSFNGSYTTTKAATCTATGTKVGKCSKCQAVVSTVTIPKLGHSESSSWTTTKTATCAATGTKVKKCTRCSSILKSETIAKTAHTFNGSYTTTKAATCTTAGTKEGKCSKCSTVVSSVTIPKLGHDTKSTWTYDSAGLHVKKCSRCNKILDSENGHTFNGVYTTTKTATCTTAGTKVGKCSKCGDVVSTVTIPAPGHRFGEEIITEQPTKTKSGLSKQTCSVCGYAKTKVLEAIDVKIEDCGYNTFYFNALGQTDASIHSWVMVQDNAVMLEIQSNQDWTMTSASNRIKLTTIKGSSYKQVSGTKGKSRIMIQPDQLPLNTKENFVSSVTFKSGTYTKTYNIEQCTYVINGLRPAEYEKSITEQPFYEIIRNTSAADYILGHKFTNGIVTGKCEGYNNYYYAAQVEPSEYSGEVYPSYLIYSVNKIIDGNSQKIDIDVIEAHNMQVAKPDAPMITAQGTFTNKMLVTINTNDTSYSKCQSIMSIGSTVLSVLPLSSWVGLAVDFVVTPVVDAIVPDNGQTPENTELKDGKIAISMANSGTKMTSSQHGMEVTLFSDKNINFSVNLKFETFDKTACYQISK